MQATGWIRWVKGAGGYQFVSEGYVILLPHQLGIVGYIIGWFKQVEKGVQIWVN